MSAGNTEGQITKLSLMLLVLVTGFLGWSIANLESVVSSSSNISSMFPMKQIDLEIPDLQENSKKNDKNVSEDHSTQTEEIQYSEEHSIPTEELQFRAELGDALAQYELGQRFEQGIGITQNYIGAHVYYNIAASSGITDASEAREQLSKKMSVDELAQARFLATMWEPQDRYEALYQAANFGDVDTLRRLIEYNVGVNRGDEDGWRAVHYAAINGHLDAVKYLHSIGGDIDREAKDGVTPLMVATHMNRIEVVNFLLDNYAEVLVESADSVTALDIAKQNGHTALIKLFSDHVKEQVKFAQAKLYDFGYDPGPADGAVGKRTIKAIKKFQKNNNLEPNGRVDYALVSKLTRLDPPNWWAALSIGNSGSSPRWKMVIRDKTRRAAEESVLSACKKDGYKNCKLETATSGCIAVLFHNGGTYWGTSNSLDKAINWGRSQCEKRYDNCSLSNAGCASGGWKFK